MLRTLENALRPHGINLIGACAAERYDATVPAAYSLRRLVPEARGVVVLGSGGDAFWLAYRAACEHDPELARCRDPLDTFTERVVGTVVPSAVPTAVRVFYPFRFPDDPVSFVRLAECAGLGTPSLTGVLVHPVYGPWFALRAAIAVPVAEPAPRPADGFDPCPGCVERPCIAACPAGAVGAAGWDVPRCAARRAADDPCGSRCHARFECVLGREHRYPPAALVHHQARALPALLQRAPTPDDR
jgi:hypothetical protein